MTKYNIRIVEDSDKLMILEWRNHSEVRAVMLTEHVITPEEHNKWWESLSSHEDRLVLILEADNIPVGVVLFNRIDLKTKTAWWGFYLDNQNLGHSQKTEAWMEAEKLAISYATEKLELYELYGDIVADNKAVWLLHQKFGFVECEIPESAVHTDKVMRYMKYVCEKNKPDERASLFLFASHNTDFLSETLRKNIQSYTQFPYQIKKIDFGRYQVDLLSDSKSDLHEPDACYVFIERIEDLFSDIYTLPTEEALLQTEQRVAEYFSFIKQIASRGNPVYVADFAIQKGFPFTIEEQLSNSRIHTLIEEWNRSLGKLSDSNLINVLPYSQVLHRSRQSFSNKYWYVARAPFSISCLDVYSKTIIGSVFATHSLSARALVLDLDNTLWKGIIGDDGIDGITLGGDFPGNIYKELQSLFLSLKERGILLTICSKNTEEVALKAIESHPEMRLRKKDFVSYRINWNPKSQNIQELASELNLGVQSLCFIDDNPVERAEVRRNLPGVYVPELPNDPADWYQFICQLPELCLTKINESDKRRAELYKKRVDIQSAQASYSDRNAFLRSLEMDICLDELNSTNFERTHQLFMKTNQFNTTTIRYTKEQLQNNSSSEGITRVIHVRSKDKYSSEYEGVAALFIIEKEDKLVIDNFVMSCRVMGRDIEHIIIQELLHKAKSEHKKIVVGRFIASSKNMPVEKLYSNNQFTLGPNGEWLFDLQSQELPIVADIMKLNWNI